LNTWHADWPLQVGQKLIISAGNITPSATLSPIQQLTPDADGRYYHIIKNGETLLKIADLYEIPILDLMSWNGLNNTSIIYIDQKLLLLLTPPATLTATPAPPTSTPSPQPSITQLPPSVTPTSVAAETPTVNINLGLMFGVIIIVFAIGLLLWLRSSPKS
jgi:LysM repeat protein